jgi:hypothetical protein
LFLLSVGHLKKIGGISKLDTSYRLSFYHVGNKQYLYADHLKLNRLRFTTYFMLLVTSEEFKRRYWTLHLFSKSNQDLNRERLWTFLILKTVKYFLKKGTQYMSEFAINKHPYSYRWYIINCIATSQGVLATVTVQIRWC